jgi:hypothetical protein
MPGGATAQRGNELFSQMLYLPAVTVPTVGGNTSVSQAVAVAGVLLGDLISWNQQTIVAGLSCDNIIASNGSLSFYWTNTTAGSLGNTTSPFIIEVTRPENVVDGGLTALPTTVF